MSQPGQFPLPDMPGIIFFFGLPLRIGRHEPFPIHMRTHLIENLKQPLLQSDDPAYPLKKRSSGGCAHFGHKTHP
ncbi:hypothetical protein, partial [Klebsiella pneumoniae]|uniref:hypothetical protein n=1 Tax=Klebsiella pneumoniae TaxID=573 RepID=UPI001C12C9C3